MYSLLYSNRHYIVHNRTNAVRRQKSLQNPKSLDKSFCQTLASPAGERMEPQDDVTGWLPRT